MSENKDGVTFQQAMKTRDGEEVRPVTSGLSEITGKETRALGSNPDTPEEGLTALSGLDEQEAESARSPEQIQRLINIARGLGMNVICEVKKDRSPNSFIRNNYFQNFGVSKFNDQISVLERRYEESQELTDNDLKEMCMAVAKLTYELGVEFANAPRIEIDKTGNGIQEIGIFAGNLNKALDFMLDPQMVDKKLFTEIIRSLFQGIAANMDNLSDEEVLRRGLDGLSHLKSDIAYRVGLDQQRINQSERDRQKRIR